MKNPECSFIIGKHDLRCQFNYLNIRHQGYEKCSMDQRNKRVKLLYIADKNNYKKREVFDALGALVQWL